MKKRIRLIALLMAVLITLSGCSYVKFENEVRDIIEQARPSIDPYEGYEAVIDESEISSESVSESNAQNGETADKEAQKDKTEEIDPSIIYAPYGYGTVKMKLMQIGESCTTLMKWTDFSDELHYSGEPDVTYTLNSVEVFDNFYESGMDPYGLRVENEVWIRSSAFIVVEFTAKYEAPEDGEARKIVSTTDIEACIIESKGIDDYYKAGGSEGMYPNVVWFSHRPSRDDPELDADHQGFSFMINDGEELTFKLGIIAGHEYVKNKNVFVRMGYIQPTISGACWKVYEIFPDENNIKYTQKPDMRTLTLVNRDEMGEIQRDDYWLGGIDFVTKTVGETFPAFMAYKKNGGDEIEYLGYQGLYLTLDNVKVYSNFSESGLSEENLYYYYTKEMLGKNNFIVVDLTAEYIAPEGGAQTIKAYANMNSMRLLVRQKEYLNDKQFPTVVWYSGEHGEKDDFTAYTISDGEKYHYQLGIITDPAPVNDNNVFLQVCYETYLINNYVYQLFELLPEE